MTCLHFCNKCYYLTIRFKIIFNNNYQPNIIQMHILEMLKLNKYYYNNSIKLIKLWGPNDNDHIGRIGVCLNNGMSIVDILIIVSLPTRIGMYVIMFTKYYSGNLFLWHGRKFYFHSIQFDVVKIIELLWDQ